jgi:CHAT domain-containing protein
LFADEIARAHFDRTRVVVLASCEGAAGRAVDGEGVLSIARAFFAAGVPAVIASLWPVRDDTEPFLATFHRELRARRGPAAALRAAQLKVLEYRGADAPLLEWAGFLAFGGL